MLKETISLCSNLEKQATTLNVRGESYRPWGQLHGGFAVCSYPCLQRVYRILRNNNSERAKGCRLRGKIARDANAAARDSNAMTGSRALSTFRVVSPFRHSELFECFSKFGAELTRAARESQLEMRVQIKSHTIKSSL